MSNVYIMVGPPCAGKSTAAKYMARNDKGIVRVNRDELRTMLRGMYSYGEKFVESLVTLIERQVVYNATGAGIDVIVDATHCTTKSINKIKDMVHEGEDVNFKYLLCIVPYWRQRWRNFWRYLKEDIWIPSDVSKSMTKNFHEIKGIIERGEI